MCAKTSHVAKGGNPCNFELSVLGPAAGARAGAEPGRADEQNRRADEQAFLVGEATRRNLQQLFNVPAADRASLGIGRNATPPGYYDYLKVERAWKITPPAATVDDYAGFCRHIRAHPPHAVQHAWQEHQAAPQQGRGTYFYNPLLNLTQSSAPRVDAAGGRGTLLKLRAEHVVAVDRLLGERNAAGMRLLEPLQRDINETLLLHGTKPATVTSILARNLDPQLAQSGLFGRGTYFAEHASKIDQYTTVDEEWAGGESLSDKSWLTVVNS